MSDDDRFNEIIEYADRTAHDRDQLRVEQDPVMGEYLRRWHTLLEGSPQVEIAIAWALSRGTDIVPLVGACRRDRLNEALGSLDITLTGQDLAAIEAAVPADAVAGTRYDAFQMSILDSERR